MPLMESTANIDAMKQATLNGSDATREIESYKDFVPQKIIYNTIDGYKTELREINRKIFDNPELGFGEFQAHDNIVSLLQNLGFTVTPHAFGMATSFHAEYGSGGRVVTYNAEYDALPDIGHACGHNLIAMTSIASFLGVAAALRESKIPGRVRLIGTPAEEEGGGKLQIIAAGAYDDVDACLMIHPSPVNPGWAAESKITGTAYGKSLANKKFKATFKGKSAHAGMAPYQGVNALDAAVLAYNGVSVLRQQIRPYDRLHAIIPDGGKQGNVITAKATAEYTARSATNKEVLALERRIKNCVHGAALATDCTVEVEDTNEYADLRPNKPLCSLYTEAMADLDTVVECDFSKTAPGPGSTDMGNVTYVCPGFHGGFAIPTAPGAYNHTPGFTAAAGSDEAHVAGIITAKGMAVAGWRVLTSDEVARKVREDFEEDVKRRDEKVGISW